MLNIKLIAAVLTMMVLGGCAVSPERIVKGSVNSAYKLAKDNSGITYGPGFPALTDGVTVQNACAAINNGDPRCDHQNDFEIINVPSAIGFSAGVTVVLALVPKNFDFTICNGRNQCSFLKVHSDLGKFGTIIEVAAGLGETSKCYWTRGGKMGSGTVCPAYNWDYRKDLRSFDSASILTGNGEMSVSDR